MTLRCDSHVHIVGPLDRFPQVPDRTYTAGPARVADLRKQGAARGVSRFVVVQPSFYGADNASTLAALDELRDDGRGVAVVDPAAATPAMLADFHRRGVRGLRINLYSPIKGPAAAGLEAAFAAVAMLAQRHGWHIQVIALLPMLLQHSGILAAAPVPVVIDHYGLYGKARPGDADGQRLLELMALSHMWIKLSAPYRTRDEHLNTRPDRDWLAAILKAAPERCVWGSDWPFSPQHALHRGANVEVPYRDMAYGDLVDHFIEALPSPGLVDRGMRDNPARLYGF